MPVTTVIITPKEGYEGEVEGSDLSKYDKTLPETVEVPDGTIPGFLEAAMNKFSVSLKRPESLQVCTSTNGHKLKQVSQEAKISDLKLGKKKLFVVFPRALAPADWLSHQSEQVEHKVPDSPTVGLFNMVLDLTVQPWYQNTTETFSAEQLEEEEELRKTLDLCKQEIHKGMILDPEHLPGSWRKSAVDASLQIIKAFTELECKEIQADQCTVKIKKWIARVPEILYAQPECHQEVKVDTSIDMTLDSDLESLDGLLDWQGKDMSDLPSFPESLPEDIFNPDKEELSVSFEANAVMDRTVGDGESPASLANGVDSGGYGDVLDGGADRSNIASSQLTLTSGEPPPPLYCTAAGPSTEMDPDQHQTVQSMSGAVESLKVLTGDVPVLSVQNQGNDGFIGDKSSRSSTEENNNDSVSSLFVDGPSVKVRRLDSMMDISGAITSGPAASDDPAPDSPWSTAALHGPGPSPVMVEDEGGQGQVELSASFPDHSLGSMPALPLEEHANLVS